MVETFRAMGYSFETAVADIIDNSISAGAKNIYINFDWRGEETTFRIKDDGRGMDDSELIRALTPGSRNPNEERASSDLGRFGLGLKTASFSQCRLLTVVAKKGEGGPVTWSWDLDHVQASRKWELIKYPIDSVLKSEFKSLQSGTIVLWRMLDRLVANLKEDDQDALKKFFEVMEKVKRHIAMVFHRFIDEKSLIIYFQDREIEPWDPFLTALSSQGLPEEKLSRSIVVLKGYVLPHKSKLEDTEFKVAAGIRGWNAHQGFYIYRNKRLLVAGDWLGFFKKEEHHKLARIQLDLPNNMDSEWQCDIKNSIARPPLKVRDQLKAYANKVRSQAVEVYRHKGKIISRKFNGVSEFQPIWNEKSRGGKRVYVINVQNPIIKELLENPSRTKADIRKALRFIEETVPVPLITIRESEEPELHAQPFEGVNITEVRDSMSVLFEGLVSSGIGPDDAIARILSIEPFNLFPEIATTLNS